MILLMGRRGRILVRCASLVVLLLLCGRPAGGACGFAAPTSDADLWYLVTLQGQHAGWMHVRTTRQADDAAGGGERITTEMEWTLTVSRAGTAVAPRKKGAFAIPPGRPCAGTRLGLGPLQLQVVWQGRSDIEGGGWLNARVPRAACGGHLQLLDLPACATSNVVRVE